MMIKFSWGFIAIPLIILFNVAMFAVEVVMLRAGTGSLNSGKPQAWSSGWQAIIVSSPFALIFTNIMSFVLRIMESYLTKLCRLMQADINSR